MKDNSDFETSTHRKMKKTVFFCFLFLSTLAFAQTEVTAYRPGVTQEGITYCLPKTVLHVVVEAKCISRKPGEFCKYAELYLRRKDVPQTEYDEWSVTSVSVVPYGVCDTSKVYSIKLRPKTSAPLVSMTDDGLLLAVNDEAEQPAPLPQPSSGLIATDADSKDYKTEEILSAGSLSKMAELTANEIYDIRENRSLLTKGQADFMPKDGEQLRLMLDGLEAQEAGLMRLFCGTSVEHRHVFTFDYIPIDKVEDQVLFRFSKHFGMVDADDPVGEAYTISVDKKKMMQAAPQDSKKKKEVFDLRYIVPGRAEITIADSHSKKVYQAEMPLAQFGYVEHLGGDLFNKNYKVSVHLSPVTGALLRINNEAEK